MTRKMIDIHVLTHSGTKPEWLQQCLDSLKDQPVVVHVVEGVEGSVGAGRAKGYALGDCEFVGYLDSDDYALEGHYAKCLRMLNYQRAVIPYEYVEYLDGSRHKLLKAYHNGAVYRRKDISPLIGAMSAAPLTVDIITRKTLKPYLMSHPGCVWRCVDNGAHRLIDGTVLASESSNWDISLSESAGVINNVFPL